MNPSLPLPAWIFFGFAVLPPAVWIAIGALLRHSPFGRKITLFALAWLIFTGSLAAMGFFSQFSAFPPRFPIFALSQFLGIAFAVFKGLTLKDLRDIPQAAWIGLQAFRLPTEWLMAGLADHQLLPVEMTFHGRNFDVVSGLLGLALGLYLLVKKDHAPRWLLYAFHLVGLLLVTAVVIQGMLSVPTPLQRLHLSVENIHLARFPLCWLPFGLVPAAYFLHFASLRKLFRQS